MLARVALSSGCVSHQNETSLQKKLHYLIQPCDGNCGQNREREYSFGFQHSRINRGLSDL